jgi:hypothetical protein
MEKNSGPKLRQISELHKPEQVNNGKNGKEP